MNWKYTPISENVKLRKRAVRVKETLSPAWKEPGSRNTVSGELQK